MRLGHRTVALLCTLILLAARAEAQHEVIDKGTLLIGGSAGISGFHRDGDPVSRFSISVAPRLGAFVLRGLAVWSSISFGHTSQAPSTANSVGIVSGGSVLLREDRRSRVPIRRARIVVLLDLLARDLLGGARRTEHRAIHWGAPQRRSRVHAGIARRHRG